MLLKILQGGFPAHDPFCPLRVGCARTGGANTYGFAPSDISARASTPLDERRRKPEPQKFSSESDITLHTTLFYYHYGNIYKKLGNKITALYHATFNIQAF